VTGAAPPGSRGLPKEQRIRRRSEYQRIQSHGQRLQTEHFIFVLAKRPADVPPSHGPRLGIAVSRRVGNAVVRNRVKRLVREAFRATRDQFGDRVDVVVIARSHERARRLADVTAEWMAASERIMKLVGRVGLARAP
jgi:ribonuclease P protein component